MKDKGLWKSVVDNSCAVNHVMSNAVGTREVIGMTRSSMSHCIICNSVYRLLMSVSSFLPITSRDEVRNVIASNTGALPDDFPWTKISSVLY